MSWAFLPNLAVSSALRSLEIVMISPFYLTAAGCAPHGLDTPSTGKPPVERTSKTRVPTGRYVTTGKQHNTAIAQLAHVTQDCTKIPIGATGKPPVERTSKTRVPTGRYVTTGKQHNTAIAQLAHVTQDCTKIPIGANRINSKHRRHNPATGETHGGF